MMTETKARALDLTEPRLAPMRRDDLPSFVVDVSTAAVLGVTAACARLGIAVGHHLPPRIAEAAQAAAEGGTRAAALVRLRLPRSLTPRLFRSIVLDVSGGPAVLFADPAAFTEDPALTLETRPQAMPSAAPVSIEPQEPAARFTFETDAEDRLRAFSPSLFSALGEEAGSWIGASFPELEAEGLIVSGQAIANALARGTSFSGVHVTVPGAVLLELELGGVPLLDGTRHRIATRGFGVMRRWTAGPQTPASAFEVAPDADVRMPIASPPKPTMERTAGPAPSNVVPFNGLTPRESTYFDEIGRTLEAAMRAEPAPGIKLPGTEPEPASLAADENIPGAGVLDTLPLATLLEDETRLVHANRTFFQWTGWPDLDALRHAGGVPGVLQTGDSGESLLLTATGETLPVEACEVPAGFQGPGARLHLLRVRESNQTSLPPDSAQEEAGPGRTALDLVPWPVLLLDRSYRILFANRAVEDRLGFGAAELEGQPVTVIIAPERRGEAIGWLDRSSASLESQRPQVLNLRPQGGANFHALAGLAPVGDDSGQVCLVLGPEPREDTQEEAQEASHEAAEAVLRPDAMPAMEEEPAAQAPVQDALLAPEPSPPSAADSEPASEPRAAATTQSPQVADAAIHLAARRLADSLDPSFSALVEYTPVDGPDLPPGIRDALDRVRKCLDDLGALASLPADTEPEMTEVAPIVHDAIAFALPAARRRHVTVRTDIVDVPDVITRPARLSRLVRLMIEDALDGAPSGTAIIVSLLCEEQELDAPVILQVSDAGAAVDEVADAAARAPVVPSPGTDRFSRSGRPMRRARLAAEARALGAGFELRRGLELGMTTQLTLPR